MPRLCSSLLLSLLIVSSASAVTIEWVPIGNPGNPGETYQGCHGCLGPTTFGSVNYQYQIAKYEVTNAQYVEFLNAKAASDPLGLYNFRMGNPPPPPYGGSWGGINRFGTPGLYSYAPIAGRENMPVNCVSVYDAMRFANWMHNGQGSGDTETGTYTLLGGTG